MLNRCLWLVTLVSMTSCTFYHAQPLPAAVTLSGVTGDLIVDKSQLHIPTLKAHNFDPSDGLDMTEVAMLAVANNPQLKISRDDAAIHHAQAFSAGLLPDPQLNLRHDFPTSGPGSLYTAFTAALSLDINSLLLHSSIKSEANAGIKQADLTLLWQEWQLVDQARLLFVHNCSQQKLIASMEQQKALLDVQVLHSKQAFAAGNITSDALNANQIAVQSLNTSLNDMQRQHLANRYALNLLLGLAPDTQLQLVDDPAPIPIDEAKVRLSLNNILEQRPDLVALKAGYSSQEQKLRQAVWAQFPILSLDISRTRDTSAVSTKGFGVNLSLPSFNRNRGAIQVEHASRQKLFDEYQVRVTDARSEILALLGDHKLLQNQLNAAKTTEAELALTAQQTQLAFARHGIDQSAFVNSQTAWLAKNQEIISLQQMLLEQNIAIETLIGSDSYSNNKD